MDGFNEIRGLHKEDEGVVGVVVMRTRGTGELFYDDDTTLLRMLSDIIQVDY